VEVRFDLLDQRKVYVWWQDRYYGEANLYVAANDYALRQEILAGFKQIAPEPLSDKIYVPPYNRLERKLAEYRLLLAEGDLNDALVQTLAKKEQIRAELTPVADISATSLQDTAKDKGLEFGLDRCTHLLSVLLKRSLDAREHLALATVWRHYGPWREEFVRQTVGRLLGQGHPSSDLMGYLDALRLAAGKMSIDT
jgi:hypothetical protein